MEPRDLKERAMRFAIEVATLCRSAQHEWPGSRPADQMFRSATSVAANYHAASRARSRPLTKEARELLAIFTASAKTAAANQPDRR
jgi:four helix bundle protein